MKALMLPSESNASACKNKLPLLSPGPTVGDGKSKSWKCTCALTVPPFIMSISTSIVPPGCSVSGTTTCTVCVWTYPKT
ncbi:MAG: hypothetical protein NWF08_08890 [Candidatus Bathyarchaeota archaeon]|nr:hypothetical protein [Candidatus Bathyarchaeota archaeon]